MDRAVMVDQLMNLVLSCNAGAQPSPVLQRITESQTRLTQLQLRRTEGATRQRRLKECGGVCVSVQQKHLTIVLQIRIVNAAAKK